MLEKIEQELYRARHCIYCGRLCYGKACYLCRKQPKKGTLSKKTQEIRQRKIDIKNNK